MSSPTQHIANYEKSQVKNHRPGIFFILATLNPLSSKKEQRPFNDLEGPLLFSI
jgi:hypothetical protein